MRWRLKSPASRLFTQSFTEAQIKKHQSSASLTFVRGIHRGPVNSPRKWPVTRKMFPLDDVIMGNPYFATGGPLYTGGHRTRVAAVTLDNMAETRSPLRKIYRKFSPCLFVTAAQLLWIDCQCYGTHWRGIPSCSDSVSRRNSGLKFRVVTRVSVVSVFPGTRVSVSPDEGTAVYKWT